MQSRDALQEFRQYAAAKGRSLSALTGAEAVDLMVGFFRDVPAEDCDPGIGADALLFQYGTYDWGGGERFEFDITRQVFLSGAQPNEAGVVEDADDYIWQLHLTLRLPPTPGLRDVGRFDRWCDSTADLEEFSRAIRESRAYGLVRDETDAEVEVLWECAG